MSAFKLRISDIIVSGRGVRCYLFVAPAEDQTFQRCGELTLTPEEAAELKALIEVSKLGQSDGPDIGGMRQINEHGLPIYEKGTPISEVMQFDRGQKVIFVCKDHPLSKWGSKDPYVSHWFATSTDYEQCDCPLNTHYVLAEDYSPTRNG